jgi:hypothetical protein
VGIRKGLMRVNMYTYFVSIYENGRMKPVEIVLRSGGEERGRMMEGINLTMIYCKDICNCYNVLSCTDIIC